MPRLEVRHVPPAVGAPLRGAGGELRERELLQARLTWPDGQAGNGEAAPLEPYDGVPAAAVAAALDAHGGVPRDAPADAPYADLLAACAAERDLPQALAAIDLA